MEEQPWYCGGPGHTAVVLAVLRKGGKYGILGRPQGDERTGTIGNYDEESGRRRAHLSTRDC
jgi:hypothetical protein